MELELYRMEAEEVMEMAVSGYIKNISKISTGRANPGILDSVRVIYYETPTPVNEIASISVPEPRQLLIKPFDISITKDITTAITNANLGVQAVNEGEKVRMTFPALTTEVRRELVKSLAKYTEQAKVAIRSGRAIANKAIKSDDELSEDQERMFLEDIQKLTNSFVAKIDELTKVKEKDLMTI